MQPLIKRFPCNLVGRDFVVGDIHGCFSKLKSALDLLAFDTESDRLFSVGDLVDRGKESADSLYWLDQHWFHAVRGNHEQMAIDFHSGEWPMDNYITNGGAWFVAEDIDTRQKFIDAFESLPVAIEIESSDGLIGIIHADCPVNDWAHLDTALNGERGKYAINQCLWSRDRISQGNDATVKGVSRVIVGHTPVSKVTVLGNVFYIDTGAVFGYSLSVIELTHPAMALAA